ncbi:hypothetical protein [Spiroplasma endosymbiont of Virgichneumon dumeticola]|uniref:hypothetical protein n=1 Tax=Spiroplasma endosymbiont of Virgichneumon dumeticola TaxID=3139323 RepID=UPI0035C8B8AA
MLDFKIIYYIGLVMFVLLLAILGWGWFSFNKPKTNNRFLNIKLLIPTLAIGVIGLILSIVPIGMQVWSYDTVFVKNDPTFLSILIIEYIFLAALLILAYVFSFDFGIAVDETNIYFFGQSVSTNKIVALDQKKHVLKIVYEQGIKKMKKRLTIITPQSQLFVKEHLVQKIVDNTKDLKSSESNDK